MKHSFCCILLLFFSSAKAQEEESSGSGCFEYQTKDIYHNWDREIVNYEVRFTSQEKCQAALGKIKTGRDGSHERIVLKSCSACVKENNQGSSGNSGGHTASSPAQGSGKPSGANIPKPSKKPISPSKEGPPKGSPSTNTTGGDDKKNGTLRSGTASSSIAANQAAPQTKEQQIAQTLIQASPGIQGAIQEYRAEKQAQEGQMLNYDEKPQGYSSEGSPSGEWVMSSPSDSEPEKSETSNSWHQDAQAIWDGVKDQLGFGEAAANASGNEPFADGFSTVSDMIGYLETTGRVEKAIQSPNDYENRAALAQDAFNYAAEAGRALPASKFGPPVDLWKRTFEGATTRMDNLLKTGDPGDESQVTAPLMDWFGSSMGLGNVGTRERNRRMEGYKSFTELKSRYGYIEATKQKFYNWMVGEK
jgi:hypothetical protein